MQRGRPEGTVGQQRVTVRPERIPVAKRKVSEVSTTGWVEAMVCIVGWLLRCLLCAAM